MIHDRRKANAADSAEICNGESPALHFFGRDFLVTRFLRELRQLDRQFDYVFLVDVANHWNEQTAICVGGHADIDVLLVDDLFLLDIDAGIELRKYIQGRGTNFQSDRGDRHLATSLFGFRSEAGTELFEFSDVGAVVLRYVRNRVPGFGQVLGSFAANAAHGDAFDFAPLGEVGKLRRNEVPGTRGRLRSGGSRREERLGVRLDVVFANAAAWTCAFDLVDIDTDFTGKTSHVRSRGDGLAMFGAGNFAELCRHAEYRRCHLRLIRRERLFFR